MSEILEPRYTVQIGNAHLAQWLKDNGAPENVLSDFILEKGCGERLELGYSGPVITIHIYSAPHSANTGNESLAIHRVKVISTCECKDAAPIYSAITSPGTSFTYDSLICKRCSHPYMIPRTLNPNVFPA